MTPSTKTPRSSPGSRLIHAGNLSPDTFAPFGQVIQNPATHSGLPELEHAVANQGTATKWIDVTSMTGHYYLGASRKVAKCVVNMFVCKPRELGQREEGRSCFDIGILERHPFTPQTFVPMGLSAEDKGTSYLVVVAPTLPSRSWEESTNRRPPYPTEMPQQPKRSLKERLLGARPNPFTNDYAPSTTPPKSSDPSEPKPKGPGPPDLENLQAFIARGDQAVTYGPGTWHAPMVVLGEKPIEFVVVQYANGVATEDCQEFEVNAEGGTLSVDLGDGVDDGVQPKAKL